MHPARPHFSPLCPAVSIPHTFFPLTSYIHYLLPEPQPMVEKKPRTHPGPPKFDNSCPLHSSSNKQLRKC